MNVKGIELSTCTVENLVEDILDIENLVEDILDIENLELSPSTIENLVEDILTDIVEDPAQHLSFEEFFGIIKNYAPILTAEQLETVGMELSFWLRARTASEHQFDLKEGTDGS